MPQVHVVSKDDFLSEKQTKSKIILCFESGAFLLIILDISKISVKSTLVITAFISFPQLPANFPQIKSKVLTAETDKGQKE